MKQKYYLMVGIITVLVIIGIIFTINYSQQPRADTGGEIAMVPKIDFQGTVVSLSLGDIPENPSDIPYGIDAGIIRLDRIISINNPQNQKIEIEEGDEITVNFAYNARPAKLRRDISPTCGPGQVFRINSCYTEGCEGLGCIVSAPLYEERPPEIEDNYIIYHLPKQGDEISETILPGVEENSKIRATVGILGSADSTVIGEYEIIS